MTKILLVDDEPQLLFSLQEYLSRIGYQVVSAESGAQALQALVDAPPNIIVSDILMEHMDGFELQQRVNALVGDSIPFIFLSAKSDLEDRLAGLEGGADDYVTKPFEPDELSARIAAVLKRVDQTRLEERRELDKLRARLLAQVATRLRTPVTSLKAHLSLLLSDRFGQSEADQKRFLQNALNDAQMLSDLVDNLSWNDNSLEGSITIHCEPVRIAPLIRSAAASAARLAQDRNVMLRISCGGLLSGNVDGPALTRALSGLLDAAVEASPPSSEARITATRSDEGGLEFIITDGQGAIEEADSMYSASAAEALDFANNVVRGHRGQVSVQQEEDGSQSLVLWLPGRIAKHIGRRD